MQIQMMHMVLQRGKRSHVGNRLGIMPVLSSQNDRKFPILPTYMNAALCAEWQSVSQSWKQASFELQHACTNSVACAADNNWTGQMNNGIIAHYSAFFSKITTPSGKSRFNICFIKKRRFPLSLMRADWFTAPSVMLLLSVFVWTNSRGN